MPNSIVVVINITDQHGNVVKSTEVSKKDIVPATDISNFGYSLKEQIEMVRGVQQNLMDLQSDFLKCET